MMLLSGKCILSDGMLEAVPYDQQTLKLSGIEQTPESYDLKKEGAGRSLAFDTNLHTECRC